MSVTTDRVAALVAPIAEQLGVELYDVDQAGPILRIMLDRPGGIDVDTLAEATRAISRALDESEPVAGSYTLEVSSPGLERPLRTAAHFAAAKGSRVKVKLRPGTAGDRRADGVLVASDDTTATIRTDSGERTLALSEVSKAHTVFEWETTPKPGKGAAGKAHSGAAGPTTTESMEDTA